MYLKLYKLCNSMRGNLMTNEQKKQLNKIAFETYHNVIDKFPDRYIGESKFYNKEGLEYSYLHDTQLDIKYRWYRPKKDKSVTGYSNLTLENFQTMFEKYNHDELKKLLVQIIELKEFKEMKFTILDNCFNSDLITLLYIITKAALTNSDML